MDGTKARIDPDTLAAVRQVEPARPARHDRWIDVVLAATPVAAMVVLLAVSPPAPAGETQPLLFELMGLGFWVALIGGVVAAIAGSSTVGRWALGAIGILAVGQVACGLGGHGSLGDGWFAAQSLTIVVAAAVVVPLALARRLVRD